jgi:hypothetical protein
MYDSTEAKVIWYSLGIYLKYIEGESKMIIVALKIRSSTVLQDITSEHQRNLVIIGNNSGLPRN